MKVIPAPLAGWTDYAFRRVLAQCGADEVWTEMISVEALYRRNPKTVAMLKAVPERVWQVVQLFGSEPAHFAAVIESGLLKDYDEVNINLGCPAPKIVKNGCGCKLMTDFNLTRAILTACRTATQHTGQKLSAKFRLGWAENVAVDYARLCAECGVERIVVHGRLGVAGYRGTADYASIAAVKAAVKIPVIANGDVRDLASAEKCLAETHADGVMMGRALCGAPWRIKLDGRVPTADEIDQLYAQQAAWHTGNPRDLIKHRLAYQKHQPK